jgi:hypothetical protein
MLKCIKMAKFVVSHVFAVFRKVVIQEGVLTRWGFVSGGFDGGGGGG